MSLADRVWGVPLVVRLAAWCVLVVGLLVYLAVTANRLLLRRVNPLFLAHRLERTLPDAKNSVVNWIDLRDESLPPVIRGSLGRRAAKDLAKADPEQAISARPLWWLGAIATALVLLQAGWLLAAPSQVLSLLQRAFFPFEGKLNSPVGPHRDTASPLSVVRLMDPVAEYAPEESGGLICKAIQNGERIELPLDRIDVAGDSQNHQFLGDYGYWFSNWC